MVYACCLHSNIFKQILSERQTFKRRTAQKVKFSINDFSSKCDQIRSFLRIWSHLLEKSLMENFFLCSVDFGAQFTDQKKPQVTIQISFVRFLYDRLLFSKHRK